MSDERESPTSGRRNAGPQREVGSTRLNTSPGDQIIALTNERLPDDSNSPAEIDPERKRRIANHLRRMTSAGR